MSVGIRHPNDLNTRNLVNAVARGVLANTERGSAKELPDDWGISTVGREFAIQLGKMLDAAKNTGVMKLYIGNRSVQWGRFDLAELSEVAMTPTDLQRFRLRTNDLLVCEGGEIGRAAIWNDPIAECYYQKALHRLRPRGAYDVRLMMSFLQLWTSTGYLENFVTQTSIAHLPKDRLEAVPLPVPTTAEQRFIAEALSDVDELLGAFDALIAKKRAIKRAAMQQLLTGKTRLPGFSSGWQTMPLEELFALVSTRNQELNDNVVTISAQQGFVRQEEFFSKRVASSSLANYYLIERGHFAYNRSYSAGYPMGAIKRLKTCDKGVVTTLYICFAVRGDGAAEPRFFEHYFQAGLLNDDLAKVATEGGRAHGLLNITKADFFSRLVRFPPPPEQAAIATVLSDMDAEITALEARRDKTRAIKQGMMQQLLTGRVRLVKPTPAETSP